MHTVVRAIAGSHLYGLNHPDSDRDVMGLGIATKEEKLGLFYKEQIGADDDVVYELDKWVRLASNGNPTVLQLLWTTPQHWLLWDDRWAAMQAQLTPLVLTQRVKGAFLGYMEGQRKKLERDRGQRLALQAQFGYDTKFAMHMIRLGLQGIEVLESGKMSLPMRPEHVSLLTSIRHGGYTEPEVLTMATELESRLRNCTTDLPPAPDPQKMSKFLVDTYTAWW